MSGVDAGVRGETTARGADFVFFAGGVFFFVGDDLFRGDDGLALATTVDAVSRRLLPDGVEAGEENGSATAEAGAGDARDARATRCAERIHAGMQRMITLQQ